MGPQKIGHDRVTFTFSVGLGFPGGSVIRNPPANVGDMGSVPDLRRSHVRHSNQACVPQLLSLRPRARDPQLLILCALEPVLHNKRSHSKENLRNTTRE